MSDLITGNLELVEQEADECAGMVYLELTGGKVRGEEWYLWFLCERHGGEPLVDGAMPRGQVAYWDGEDIVVDGRARPANHRLRWAPSVDRATVQEMVGQRVAALFMRAASAQGITAAMAP
jgi:hypothetical protein